MNLLRNVLSDLVEKRLWPVAAALVLALVAVPLALGGGGGGQGPGAVPGAPVAVAGAPAAAGVVAVTGAEARRIERDGRLRNPFEQQVEAEKAATASAAKTVADAVADVATKATGSGSGSAPAAPAPEAPATGGAGDKGSDSGRRPRRENPVVDVHRVTVRFGNQDDMRTIRDLPPLAPLPDREDPYIAFLGVKDDDRTLRFLLSSDVIPVGGEFRCRPSREECEQIEIRPGSSFGFAVQHDDGFNEAFRLDVVSVRRRSVEGSRAITARVAKLNSMSRADRKRAKRRAVGLGKLVLKTGQWRKGVVPGDGVPSDEVLDEIG